jgi:proline dehydrogenase
MLENLRQATQMARSKKFVLGAKLVRGAYMEKEAAFAEKQDLQTPFSPVKRPPIGTMMQLEPLS